MRFEQLAVIRARSGLSQSALAKLAGITPSALSMIEAGKREPIMSTAFALADALNTTVDDIAGRARVALSVTVMSAKLTKAQQQLAQIRDLAGNE